MRPVLIIKTGTGTWHEPVNRRQRARQPMLAA